VALLNNNSEFLFAKDLSQSAIEKIGLEATRRKTETSSQANAKRWNALLILKLPSKGT